MSGEPRKPVLIKHTNYPTEAFISRTRNRLGASNRNSGHLVESRFTPINYSPIGKLPEELLLHIFNDCEPHAEARLRLTHICRRWRLVSITSPLLWTSIAIGIHRGASEDLIDRILSRLFVQLERARDNLLDVHWIIYPDKAMNTRLINFRSIRSSFSQWRTLKLEFIGYFADWESISQQREVYAFPNLQSLRMNANHQMANLDILEGIVRTTTSTLKVLDLHPTADGELDLGTTFGRLLTRVKRLVLPMESSMRLHLPRNIVDLRAQTRREHLFPYILRYELSKCIISTNQAVDLRSLTKLTIRRSLEMDQDCQVTLPALQDLHVDICFLWEHATLALPALRNLNVGELSISDQARLEGPLLERLHFRAADRDPRSEYQINSKSATDHPGYLLSPSISLRVDISMSSADTIKLLGKHSQVQEVTLRFNDPVVAQCTLESMCERYTTGGALPGSICPHLKELRLDFEWSSSALDKEEGTPVSAMEKKVTSDIVPEVYEFWRDEGWWASEFDRWKARAGSVVSARRTTGVIPDIYASWTDSYGYVLLT